MLLSQESQSETPRITEPSTSRAPAAWPSGLVGVTATGPIYRTTAEIGYIPLGSALHLLQELALRIDHPRARVVSSLAGRVQGEVSHKTWIRMSAAFTAGLAVAPVAVQTAVLRQVIAEVRASGKVDGLEPVLCAAINGVWPWLHREATDTVIDFALAKLAASEIARRHTVPVVDPNTRTATVFGPGELNKLDLSGWRADRAIHNDAYLSGIPGLGPTVGDITGRSRPEDSIGWGSGGLSASDLMGDGLGRGPAGVPGGLPTVNDLPSGHGRSNGAGHQSLDDIAAGWLGGGLGRGPAGVPGGLPTVNDLPGGRGAARTPGRQSLDDIANDWLRGTGSEWGHVGREMGGGRAGGLINGGWGGGTPGGPFGHPGQLGVGADGVSDATDRIVNGLIGVAAGVGLVVSGPATGPGAPIMIGAGFVAVGAGAYSVGLGIGELVHGSPTVDKPSSTKPSQGGQTPKPTDEKPAPKPKDPPPPPDELQKGDTYPAPDPGGNALWDDEHPGGHPNTIWDDNVSGGGTGPNRIWDDSQPGGGVGPTRVVAATVVSVPALAGPGLRAGITQVGPATVAF